MPQERAYNREAAVAYAKEWALNRNPDYVDFESMGGDCTNFASQCLFAGSKAMNYTPTFGWYFHSLASRAPAWTGVEFLHQFLTGNKGSGPFAREVPLDQCELGDLIQLGRSDGHFYHSLVVCAKTSQDILICAHTYDAYMRPLSEYFYDTARCIHIDGVRTGA